MELGEAVASYDERLSGLGQDLLAEVEAAVAVIESQPRIGAPYKKTDLRRFVLRRFPFALFFLEPEDILWIVAVAHTSRRPDYWKRRQAG